MTDTTGPLWAFTLLILTTYSFAQTGTGTSWKPGIPYAGEVRVEGVPEAAYWLQLPDGFSEKRSWPLILFFPGRMYGTKPEVTNFLKPEFAGFRAECRKRGYIVASIAHLTDLWMNQEARRRTDLCLEHILASLPVDRDRIFAAGLSMGGGAALTYAIHRPGRIKGVCNLMGCTDFRRFYVEGHYTDSIAAAFGGSPTQVPEVYAQQSAAQNAEALRDVPVITIHGDHDTCIPVWNATVLWEQIGGFDNGSVCIILEGVGHTNEVIVGLEDRVLDLFDKAVRPSPDGGTQAESESEDG